MPMFELPFQLPPPPATRKIIVAAAREKLLRDIVMAGYEPLPETFEVIWLDDVRGTAKMRGEPKIDGRAS